MYAVIRTGGKQARVTPGDRIRVEKLAGGVGEQIELAEILLVGGEGAERIGTPLVAGARVVGTITAQDRAAKVLTFKMKRRKGYRRKIGHRQDYTEIRVDRIEG
jgi:large subunit ribosomal protein L21